MSSTIIPSVTDATKAMENPASPINNDQMPIASVAGMTLGSIEISPYFMLCSAIIITSVISVIAMSVPHNMVWIFRSVIWLNITVGEVARACISAGVFASSQSDASAEMARILEVETSSMDTTTRDEDLLTLIWLFRSRP